MNEYTVLKSKNNKIILKKNFERNGNNYSEAFEIVFIKEDIFMAVVHKGLSKGKYITPYDINLLFDNHGFKESKPTKEDLEIIFMGEI